MARTLTALALVFVALVGPGASALAQDGATTTKEQLQAARADAPTSARQVVMEIKASLWEVWDAFVSHLPLLALGFVVLLLTWLAGRLFSRFAPGLIHRLGIRRSLEELSAKLIYLGIWLAGATLAAMIIFPGLTPASALAGLGAGSVAIGFAFRDIFENFLAGMIILANDAYSIGDMIACEGIEGKVESISVRNTSIRMLDGQLVVVPNAHLFKNPVTVRTDQDVRRTTIMCGVGYGEDVQAATSLVEKTVQALESVRSDRPVQVFAREFGASSVDFEVTWWTGAEPLNIRRSRHQVVTAVKQALDDAGIEIPYPYRTMTFAEPLKTVAVSAE